MNKLLTTCPSCEHELNVTALECGNCGVEIHGHFAIGRFARLGADDLRFIENFVKNRGNAYRVAAELEIPYSGVRARLSEIIAAMGYAPESEAQEVTVLPPQRRIQVLEQVAGGKLTAEQAVKIFQGESA